MSLWILDTDHLSLWQNEHLLVKQRINQKNPQEIAVTVISMEEQMRGWLNVIRKFSESDRQLWAYKGFKDGVEFFQNVNLLDFNQDAYDCYRELLRQRIRIGTQDLRIAAITISINGILVTRNRRDFEKVPGLVFEDWTVNDTTQKTSVPF